MLQQHAPQHAQVHSTCTGYTILQSAIYATPLCVLTVLILQVNAPAVILPAMIGFCLITLATMCVLMAMREIELLGLVTSVPWACIVMKMFATPSVRSIILPMI